MNALVIVDIQNDFLPGGALAVAEGDQIVPIVNGLMDRFDLVVATQDWHPADHGSFAANHPGKKPFEMIELDGLPQVLWPVHCVQNTHGANFASDLDTGKIKHIFRKGENPKIDSYSGFFDNGHRRSTGLGEFLKQAGANNVFVCGLATDYCVKFTALDARSTGFRTHLIADACRGVNLKSGDVEAAIAEMKAAGIFIMQGASDAAQALPQTRPTP
ncbi:MAG TPA: bifunctional nicotinamidase/pyrazinamidase [Tepidisphaeraceae bacterium]|nr:bifunctional nicotinamidase/pyrazinamidase [Tepidisphaeraceae bacterium]